MIPYFEQPVIRIGPLTVHAFSVLLIVGILVGRWIIGYRARLLSLDQTAVADLCLWGLISGFMAAHFAAVILHNVPRFLLHPSNVLRAGGIASIPGLIGGLLGVLVWSRLRALSGLETFRILDVVAYAAPFASIIGRLGCLLAHDHRGLYTTSWIGVRFPEGTRYDLGLTELLFLIPFAALFCFLGRQPKPVGFFFGLYGVVYGLYRVWQDTLHIQPPSFWNGRYGDTIGGSLICLVGLMGWAAMVRWRAHRSLWSRLRMVIPALRRTRDRTSPASESTCRS